MKPVEYTAAERYRAAIRGIPLDPWHRGPYRVKRTKYASPEAAVAQFIANRHAIRTPDIPDVDPCSSACPRGCPFGEGESV